jgi:hypothetical protein
VGRALCKVTGCISVCFQVTNVPKPGFAVPVSFSIVGSCIHKTVDNEDRENALIKPVADVLQKRFLRGTDRLKTISEIQKSGTKAKSFYYSKLSEMKEAKISSGNITTCQTPQVLRQAMYENTIKKRLAYDVMEELVIQKQSWGVVLKGEKVNGFVQCIGYCPFFVTFYTEQQVKMFIRSCSNNRTKPTTLHFDATGSVMKNIANQKTPYYYTLQNEESNIPILELLSTCHNTRWIANLINTFLLDVVKLNNKFVSLQW